MQDTEQQEHMQLHMQLFYCKKYLRRLGLLGGDGFALCSGETDGLPLLLCTAAFAYALGIENTQQLRYSSPV